MLYAALLLLLALAAVVYYEILPASKIQPPRQVLGLALLAAGVLGSVFALSFLVARDGLLGALPQAGETAALLGLGLGIVAYAVATVYGRALAVAPSLRRGSPR